MPIDAKIVPLNDGTGAWLFFDDPLPGGEAITLNVDGDAIRAADGAMLDADGEGTPGGLLSRPFTTVSTSPVPGTVLTGLVLDPGSDLIPMTPDDFVASPNGAQDFGNHTYLNPIAGAEVYILGREDEKVLTDANGRFTLTNVPAGQIKLVVDGRTADNAPAAIYFPEMVLDVTVRPGVINTIMGGMGPDEAQIARIEDEAFYLPRIDTATLMPLSDTQPTVVSPVSAAGTNLTAEQASQITLTIQPGSLVDEGGNPVTNGEIGIAVVPGVLVVDMLPEGMPVPPIFLTIQGTQGGVFTEEAILSLPNVFNLEPGEQTPQFSYDHTTGLLVLNGYSTVTKDGALLVSDPGSGILQPGWNGAPPQRFSVLELDPRVYCPPETGPHDGVRITAGDYIGATANVTTPIGTIGRTLTAVDAPIGGPVIGGALGTVNTAGNLNRLYNDLRDIKRAVVDNEVPPGLGGEVDGNLGLILGAKLVRDTGKTLIDGAATFFNALGLGTSPPGRVANGLSATISYSEAAINYLNDDSNLQPTEQLLDRLRQQQNAPRPPNKPVNPNDPDNSATREAADQLQRALQEFEDDRPQLVQLHGILRDQAQPLRDFFDDFDENQPYGGKELSDLVDIDPGTGEVVTNPDTGLPESELIRRIAEFVETAQQIREIGDLIQNLQAIRDAIAAAEAAVSENFSEPLTSALSGGNDLVGTTGGLVYEFLYGPIFYGMLTNLETGEVERFTFNPAQGYTFTLKAASILDRGGAALGTGPITSGFDVIAVEGQTWISPASGTWNDPFNWSTGRTPETADNVFLPLATGVVALINEDVGEVASVSVSGEGVLRTTLPSPASTGLVTGALTNQGNIDVQFGRLENNGTTNNSGVLGVSGRGNHVARGDIVNSGEIVISVLAGMNENAVLTTNAPLIELTGGGTVRLEDADGDESPRVNLRGSDTVTQSGTPIAETFRNVDNTVIGTGGFGAGFIFENLPGGQVIAEDGDEFVITSGQIVNTGLIAAQKDGLVSFDSEQFVDPGGLFIVRVPGLIENSGGTISAAGGSVWLNDSTLRGGTLDGTLDPIASGALVSTFGRSFLQGTISNSFQLSAGTPGRFDEFGTFVVEASGIWSLTGDTTLEGGGLISLSRAAGAEAAGSDAVLTTEVANETYDGDTGDLLSTEGYTLTLANQSIFGRGTIGLSDAEDLDDGFMGDPALYPRLQIEIAAPSRIDANSAADGLTINRVDIVNEGEIRVSGGSFMDIVSSTLQQINGRISVDDGTLTISDPEFDLDPTDFSSSGSIDVQGAGFLSIEQSIENQGTITVFGSMEAHEYIFGGSLGTIFPVGVVQLHVGTGNTIDFAGADGTLVLGDASSFLGVIDFFEAGDRIHFTEFDPFETTFSFVDNGPGAGTGTLTLDDGFGFTADIAFNRPAGGFGPNPEDNFTLEESDDYGGTLLSSALEYF